ncbi:MAG: glycosyltransferase family 39 protein, partial [bacterium]|nr:glycosyltransferase family 39 protein [bacterium]
GLPDKRHLFSYHPDEFYMVGGILNMDPLHLDLNPDFFNYGTLFIYLMAIASSVAKLFIFPQTDAGWMALYIVSGRAVSALLGTLSIGLVFLSARRLGGIKAGIISALLLTFWPIHLVHSHFATVDVTAAFFVALTLWLCLKVYDGEDKALFWAALSAGLAAATRYNTALVFIAVPAALWLRSPVYRKQDVRRMFLLLPVALAGFLLGCPYALLAPAEFIPAVRHAQGLITSGLGDIFSHTPPGWIYHLTTNFLYGLGLPAMVLAVAATVHGLRSGRGKVILIWALLFYLLIGAAQVKFMRYMLPLTPALAIASGVFIERLLVKTGGRLRIGIALLTAFTLIYTVIYGLSFAALTGGRDPRDIIADQLIGEKPGTSVGMINVSNFSTPPLVWYNGGKVAPEIYLQALKTCRFKPEIVPFDAGNLQRLDSKYLVLSEYDYREVARQHPETFAECMTVIDERYRLMGMAAITPHLGPLRFNKGFPPHDLLYIYPETRLYRRKE